MARGPAPKDPTKRSRRNPDPVQHVEVAHDARPPKPPALPGAKEFGAETRRWYRTWATSPQATLFTATDWQRLHMLAPTVQKYFEGDLKLLAEIRLNEERLGATIVDRQRMRLKIGADAASIAPPGGKKSSRSRPDPRRLALVK